MAWWRRAKPCKRIDDYKTHILIGVRSNGSMMQAGSPVMKLAAVLQQTRRWAGREVDAEPAGTCRRMAGPASQVRPRRRGDRAAVSEVFMDAFCEPPIHVESSSTPPIIRFTARAAHFHGYYDCLYERTVVQAAPSFSSIFFVRPACSSFRSLIATVKASVLSNRDSKGKRKTIDLAPFSSP